MTIKSPELKVYEVETTPPQFVEATSPADALSISTGIAVPKPCTGSTVRRLYVDKVAIKSRPAPAAAATTAPAGAAEQAKP
jgi:hypothetical protein